jgi:N-acetylmuramic acid 6-phosphate etherase
VEGAEDETGMALEQVRSHGVGADDALVAVAASGTTPFTLACLREAKLRGALTIGIANNPSTPLLDEAEHPILLETGAEPIAGSTRMNAGTAQRITLNVLSTLLMIRLGRVYRGLMVDVDATNAKLALRREAILLNLTGRSREDVQVALRQADGNVKLAVLLLGGCGPDMARAALASTGGQLREAIALVGQGPCESLPRKQLPEAE